MVKIQKLSTQVQTFLRTGVTMNDTVQCIIELVQNSLDAQSTSIAVRIDLHSFIFQVVDNGHGLTKKELNIIGTRYMTNKCHSLNDLKTKIEYYGFRGEALASLRESCEVLMVISKHRGCDKTYSKVFRADKETRSAGVAVHNRMCNGTTVVVKDYLFNFPVRRARIQPAIELENIKHALLALSIINHQVSFTLRNDVTKTVILQTHEYANIGDALSHHCNIKEKHILIPVSVFIPPFKVSAHISRETEPSDHFQFIFVNKRLVTNKTMYKIINKKLAISFYLRNTGKRIDEKSAEKNYSIFVINIQCPHIEYDITYDPKKLRVEFRNWDIIITCLEQIIDKFISTEDNLNFVKEVKNQEENLTLIKKSPVINKHTVASNVLYGASKKRVHDTNTKGQSPIKKCSIKTTNDKKCVTHREENNNNHKKVSSSAETLLHFKQHSLSHCKRLVNSTKSINKSTKLSSDCVTHKEENNNNHKKVSSSAETLLHFKQHSLSHCKRLVNSTKSINKSTKLSSDCVTHKEENNNNHKKVSSSAETLLHFKQHCKRLVDSTKSINKSTKLSSDCVTHKEENNNNHKKVSSSAETLLHFKQHCKRLVDSTKSINKSTKLSSDCVTHKEENNNNHKKVSSSAETLLHFKQHCKRLVDSTKSINKSTKLSSDCVMKSDLENPLPFKAPGGKPCFMKRKLLSEHIITESESDPTPTKQKCIWDSTILQLENNPKNTILPIISQDFFDNAVKDMRLTRNVLLSNSENYGKYDTSNQTLQINLYRSIKKLNNRKSLKLTQKQSLNYLNNNKSVHSKCRQSTQSIVLTESSLKNVSNYLIKEDNLDKNIQFYNVKIQPKLNQKKFDGTKLVHKNIKDKDITHNRKYCNLKQNWKLFTPTFKTQDSCKSYKSLHIVRAKGSKNMKSKVLMTMNKKSIRSDEKIKATIEETGRTVNNSHEIIKCQTTQNTSTKTVLIKSQQIIKTPECRGKVSSQSNKLIESRVIEQSACSSKTQDLRIQQIKKIGTGIDLSNFQKAASSAQNTNESLFTFLNNHSGGTYLHKGKEKDLVSEKKKFGEENRKQKVLSITSTESYKVNEKNQQEIKGLRNTDQDYGESQIVCTNNEHFKDSNDPLMKQYVPLKSCINSSFSTDQYGTRLLNNPNTIENFVQNETLKDSVVVVDLTQYVNEVTGVTLKGDQEYRIQSSKSPVCTLSPELKQNSLNSKVFCVLNENKDNFKQSRLSNLKKNVHLSETIQQEDNKVMNNEKLAENINGKYGQEDGGVVFDEKESKISVYENEQNNINFENSTTCETTNKVSEFDNKFIYIAEENKDFHLGSNHKHSAGSSVKNDNFSLIPEDTVLLSQFRKDKPEVLSQIKIFEENSKTNLDKETNTYKVVSNTAESWNRETIPNGKQIYINSLTGMSSFSTPVTFENPHILSNRYWFMPKGISPLLHIIAKTHHDIEKLSKNEKDTIHNIIASTNKTDSATFEPNNSQIPERVLHMLAGADYKGKWNSSYQFKRPCVFSNESIQMAKVVGQIDNKFIAALLHPQGEKKIFLVLFDQHAVDERIRVEMLTAGYKNNSGQLKSQSLSPSIEVFLAENEIVILTELLPRLQKLGIKLVVKEGKVFVCEIPLCMFNKISKENQIDMMTALIKQLLISAEDSRGVIPSLPHFIADIINTEACRGAIKFGDKISLEESKFLLSKLALCEMPFQCAHGRPVLTPLIEIENIQSQDGPIHLMNLAHICTSTHFDVIE